MLLSRAATLLNWWLFSLRVHLSSIAQLFAHLSPLHSLPSSLFSWIPPSLLQNTFLFVSIFLPSKPLWVSTSHLHGLMNLHMPWTYICLTPFGVVFYCCHAALERSCTTYTMSELQAQLFLSNFLNLVSWTICICHSFLLLQLINPVQCMRRFLAPGAKQGHQTGMSISMFSICTQNTARRAYVRNLTL